MEIKAKSSNVGRYEEYLLIASQSGASLKNMVGEVLDVDSFVIYERPNRDSGEIELAFSMSTPEGEVYGSGSQAFCDTFLNSILTFFEPDEVKKIRIEKAKQLLMTTNLKMFEISSDVGFSHAKYFGQVFKQEVGLTPVEYQRTIQKSK